MNQANRRNAVDKEPDLWEKILRYVRDELYLELRFLGLALSSFTYQADERLTTMATDGEKLYYSEEQLLSLFEKNPGYLNRIYLHSVLHCLFSHLWLQGDRDRYLWGIACDIAVEYTIDHMEKEGLSRILTLMRTRIYDELERGNRSVSAAGIYQYLKKQSPERIQQLHREFFADDHVFWPKQEKNTPRYPIQQSIQNKWKKLSHQTQIQKRRQSVSGDESGQLVMSQLRAERSRRSYREFLRQFMIVREEMHLDPDEFDLGFYLYGLSLYRNMPLIEPMESREIERIQDFVVVVDTSDSTSGSLVRNFLRETFHLITQQNTFFKTYRIHLIQADEKVRSDILLKSEEQIERLFQNFEIKGGGNTDFRPVFRYVDEKQKEGSFEHLCGLIYFTDGKGTYPEKSPSYRTAFLFLEDFDEKSVPPWAIRMKLEPEEFEPGQEKR